MADPKSGQSNRNEPDALAAPTPLWALFGLSGRLNRAEYWWSQALLISSALIALYSLVGRSVTVSDNGMLLVDASSRPGIYFIATITSYISFAVAVKRLHDLGLSGLLAVATLIPMLNIMTLFVLGLMPGARSANRYGPPV